MGLLTDPTASKKKSQLAKILIKYQTPICVLLYVIGCVYLCSLAHSSRNNATYFSENALLPGLVHSDIRAETANDALRLHDELLREREIHRSTMPTAWILAKLRQIGLETYTHNFTLNYPLGGGRVFNGKNVYGILRAPRIGSTESIVISTPYRPPDSINPEATCSLPILLAFANFARKQNYWAKDVIFLITEQEQLGMQAWLEAYHGSYNSDGVSVLDFGTLDARAGSIQAAVNLEIQGFDVDFIDVKVEGLNGQLPNLDLLNLIQRLALKEGISSGHKQTSNQRRSGVKGPIAANFWHMISMILTQSTGIPNGNHGLFHRYGIEALTLEAHKRESTNHQRRSQGANALIKLVEGISRSLNNLLERFHQSFFFYLLVASDRFVSIGDYMPSLALIAGSLLIKAFIIWLSVNQSVVDEHESDELSEPNECIQFDFNYVKIGKLLILAHVFGFVAFYLPHFQLLQDFSHQIGVNTELFLTATFLVLSIFSLFTPLVTSFNSYGIEVLHIAALLETGTALIIIGMVNFSLGLLLSVFITPLAIIIGPNVSRFKIALLRFICLLFNPILVTYFIVFVFTWQSFGELSLLGIFKRSIPASMDAVTFAVVDSMIYGNWLFPLTAIIFFPMWILFWNTITSCKEPITAITVDSAKKTN